jgi:hypothetical protein
MQAHKRAPGARVAGAVCGPCCPMFSQPASRPERARGTTRPGIVAGRTFAPILPRLAGFGAGRRQRGRAMGSPANNYPRAPRPLCPSVSELRLEHRSPHVRHMTHKV